MATAVPLDMEDEAPLAAEGLMLQDILSGQNLAEMLEPNELTKIGQQVIRDVEIDEQSRGDWQKRYQGWLDVAMQVRKAKTFPWPNAANVKLPQLTVACIQFQAEAYPVIVDGSNLVKGKVLGPDPDGKKRARADRMGQHMSFQFLYRMPDWEEETDKLLLMLPITGCVIRKVYYDEIENANRSEIISAEDFIINYWAKSIKTAPRFTHVLHYYPYEVEEFVSAGLWKEVSIDDEDAGEDDQALGDYYEQHRCIDLDGDGRPEHYVVTCTKEGEVARIVPCFGPEDITVHNLADGKAIKLQKLLDAGRIDLAGDIIRIERRQYFVKYGFIPAPDGSFYDIGFGSLLDDITDTSNSTVNRMLDAGTLQNAGGGFVGSGINIRGGNFRFAAGEYKRVDAPAGPLKDNFMQLPAPGPSPVLFQLLELLVQSAKDITSSQDVISGRSTPNQPATTTLALIEQAQVVRKGIYKRIHRSFGQECRCVRQLNKRYLDDEEYFNLSDPEPLTGEDGQPVMGPDGKPQTTDTAQIGRADYEDDDLDVMPVSDPGQVSDMQKITRAEARFQMFNNDPLINQKQLRQDVLEALGTKDIPRYLEVPKPAPDPKLLLEMGKVALEKEKVGALVRQSDATASGKLAAAAEVLANLGLLEDAAALAGASMELSGDIQEGEHADNGAGGLSGMGTEPADQGVPQPLAPAPDAVDGGMGPGGGDFPGGAGPSGAAGPIVETPL